MYKQEFIDKLRLALTGRISPEQVQENVDYYEDYINTQIRMGHGEEEVLETLGDPRLIAKTIIVTSGQDQGDEYESERNRDEVYHGTGYDNELKKRIIHLPGWLWAIIVVLVLVLVLGIVFTLLSAFAPLIIILIIVVALVKFFDRLN